MQNGKFLILFLIISFYLCNCKSVNKLSHSKTDISFSPEEFIFCTGYGSSPALAAKNADSELSLYFRAKVNTYTKSQNIYLQNSNNTFSQKFLSQQTDISSENEFYNLKHTKACFNENHKLYEVTAFINRKEALEVTELRMNSIKSQIEIVERDFSAETEAFIKITLLSSLKKLTADFYKLYYFAITLDSVQAEKYRDLENLLLQLNSEEFKLKKECMLLFKYDIKQKNIEIKTKVKIKEIFNREGFVFSEQNFRYILNLCINSKIQKLSNNDGTDVYISYPAIDIQIEDINGKGVFSYSRQFEKVSAYSEEGVERMILNKIDNDLKNNLWSKK